MLTRSPRVGLGATSCRSQLSNRIRCPAFLVVTCANGLVVQNRHDPVTPHRGGELLDEKFGDRSRLVSVDGSGHGVYVTGDNACALNTTTSFLVAGKLPKRDVSCR